MQHAETLKTIAEIGATFGGFAALVTAFSQAGSRVMPHDLTRLHVAVGGALMAVFGGLVPFVVGAYALGDSTVSRISAASVLLLVFSISSSICHGFEASRPT